MAHDEKTRVDRRSPPPDAWAAFELDELPGERGATIANISSDGEWRAEARVIVMAQRLPWHESAFHECFRAKLAVFDTTASADDVEHSLPSLDWSSNANYELRRYKRHCIAAAIGAEYSSLPASLRLHEKETLQRDVALHQRAIALARAFDTKCGGSVGSDRATDASRALSALNDAFVLEMESDPSLFLCSRYPPVCGGPGGSELGPDGVSARGEAFSHWTFEESRGRLLVVEGDATADAVVHTSGGPAADGGRGLGNCGTAGMASFFLRHRCGARCSALGLSRLVAPEKSVGFAPAPSPQSPSPRPRPAAQRPSAAALAAHVENATRDGRELAAWLPSARDAIALEARCFARVGAALCATEAEWRAARKARQRRLEALAATRREELALRVQDLHGCLAIGHLRRLESAVHLKGRGWVERAARCRRRALKALAAAGGAGVALARQLRGWDRAMRGSGATLFADAFARSESSSAGSDSDGSGEVIDMLRCWECFIDDECASGRPGRWGSVDIAAPSTAFGDAARSALWYVSFAFGIGAVGAAARWLRDGSVAGTGAVAEAPVEESTSGAV
jgi:hypothetical protein